MSYIYGAIAASFTPVANRATDSLSDNNAPTVGRNQPGHATGTTSGLSGGFLFVTTPTARPPKWGARVGIILDVELQPPINGK